MAGAVGLEGREKGEPVGAGAAHQLAGVLGVDAFRQHLQGAAGVAGAAAAGHGFHQGIDLLEPLHLHVFRELAGPIGRRGVGPGRIGRRIDQIEADLFNQGQGAAELGVGFAGECHDHIGADRGLWHPIANAINDAAVAINRVAPGHGLEHVVITALEGDVEVFAHLGQVGAGVDQPLGEVAGMARGEADPFDARHVVHLVQQVGEGVLAAAFRGDAGQVAAIGIDVLPQQGDLFDAAGGQTFHFQLDGAR